MMSDTSIEVGDSRRSSGSSPWHAAFVAATVFALTSCARTHGADSDLMQATAVCDTQPMKPIGRAVRIPSVPPSPALGALVGIVYQKETGDALAGAAVGIAPAVDTNSRPVAEHITDEHGAFAFEGIAPGLYRVRVRRINQYRDSAFHRAVAGRVDTLRIAMRAYRCQGY